jgi:hypothetical protein
MRRGFYLSITAVIILIIITGLLVSSNRTGSFERELRIEADRAHAMTSTLVRIRSDDIPNVVSLALKEAVVELGDSLTNDRLKNLARTGSEGSLKIDHPLTLLEARGSEITNDPVMISIVSFDITDIAPVPSDAFLVKVTYHLAVSIDSERVEGTFAYSGVEESVSIIGAMHPVDTLRITKTDYRPVDTEVCYLELIGAVSNCNGQEGLEPKP